jgi:hypothetical protein
VELVEFVLPVDLPDPDVAVEEFFGLGLFVPLWVEVVEPSVVPLFVEVVEPSFVPVEELVLPEPWRLSVDEFVPVEAVVPVVRSLPSEPR